MQHHGGESPMSNRHENDVAAEWTAAPGRPHGRAGKPWALILAGGDGVRLRPLTRQIAGDDRPKQFCALLGRDTLWEQTRRRAQLSVAPSRVVSVVTESHERYYPPLLAGERTARVVVQPENRGTGPRRGSSRAVGKARCLRLPPPQRRSRA